MRARLAGLPAVDDVSLFGTRLHLRGADGTGPEILDAVRRALADLVPAEGTRLIPPALEDVFVLAGEGDEA